MTNGEKRRRFVTSCHCRRRTEEKGKQRRQRKEEKVEMMILGYPSTNLSRESQIISNKFPVSRKIRIFSRLYCPGMKEREKDAML